MTKKLKKTEARAQGGCRATEKKVIAKVVSVLN
jgi:hypothetical protein